MNQYVIYPKDEGGIAVIVASPEVTSIDQLIAAVPAGKKYKVVTDEDFPADRSDRSAWTADFEDPVVATDTTVTTTTEGGTV